MAPSKMPDSPTCPFSDTRSRSGCLFCTSVSLFDDDDDYYGPPSPHRRALRPPKCPQSPRSGGPGMKPQSSAANNGNSSYKCHFHGPSSTSSGSVPPGPSLPGTRPAASASLRNQHSPAPPGLPSGFPLASPPGFSTGPSGLPPRGPSYPATMLPLPPRSAIFGGQAQHEDHPPPSFSKCFSLASTRVVCLCRQHPIFQSDQEE